MKQAPKKTPSTVAENSAAPSTRAERIGVEALINDAIANKRKSVRVTFKSVLKDGAK